MKLWEKGIITDKLIEEFTVGRDAELDLLLAPFDLIGSIAHGIMLHKSGLINNNEMYDLHKELVHLYHAVEKNEFIIEKGVEDVHSQVELMLTKKLGDTGKKIHTARSRNDQVLLDIRLFVRDEIKQIVALSRNFFDTLIMKSEHYKDYLMPGYTHLQVAMPSSFGLWFGAFAESLTDDMQLMQAAYRIINRNPLGSAAGYGSSFPVNRQLTTDLLGFDDMNYNVVYAQMGRGKTEKTVSYAIASLAGTISKMANDVCLFVNQNFGFVNLPDSITTGSSIMPHKKNPDVFELLRSKCNKIQALSNEIQYMTSNLFTGYFRDYQILKESFLPVFSDLKLCLQVADFAVSKVIPVSGLLENDIYKYIFSVEEVNKLVMKGMPFRKAYQEIAGIIAAGEFNPQSRLNHVHEGSIGNLCNDKIGARMSRLIMEFGFEKSDTAIKKLLEIQELEL